VGLGCRWWTGVRSQSYPQYWPQNSFNISIINRFRVTVRVSPYPIDRHPTVQATWITTCPMPLPISRKSLLLPRRDGCTTDSSMNSSLIPPYMASVLSAFGLPLPTFESDLRLLLLLLLLDCSSGTVYVEEEIGGVRGGEGGNKMENKQRERKSSRRQTNQILSTTHKP
jgi:hypothetical protein